MLQKVRSFNCAPNIQTDRTIESFANEIQKKRSSQMQSMGEAAKRKENERQVVRSYFEGNMKASTICRDWLLEYPDSWRLHFFKGCALAA